MPTYSYRCTACDHAFDIQQAFSDESLTVCPSCKGELRKVFNTIGVTFQGSGFYRTDSRAEAKGKSGGKSASLPAKESPKKESPKKETPTKSSTPTSS
jgi:putative FmdB family regulatory protein